MIASDGGELVVNVRGGVRVCVPSDISLYTPFVLLEQEDWFEDEIRFVRRWLREGMRAVDVGASYGLYTLAMASAVGAAGRVWAFEPTPAVADYLDRSVRLNGLGSVRLRRVAVSDRPGSLDFHMKANAELNAVASSTTEAPTVRVPAVTLDQASDEEAWGTIDFLKLDIEGHESEAVQGARRLLERTSPVVMVEIKEAEKQHTRHLQMLRDMGYGIYRLLAGPLVLVPMDPGEAISNYQLNAFACKPERAADLATGGFLVHGSSAKVDAPPREAWMRFARSAPYARELHRSWSHKGGPWLSAHRNTYLEGLAAYALSRDTALGANDRVAWLFRSLKALGEAVQMNSTPARRLSYARAARDASQREDAVEALRDTIVAIESGERMVLREPFLAPSLRWEGNPMRPGDATWVRCAALEEMERLRTFSSRFDLERSQSFVEEIVAMPGHSLEMDRRHQLIRMVRGIQARPEPVAALLERSEDNLNPEFWAAMARDA